MITLNRDTLSFTFPELARQVRLIVDLEIQNRVSTFPLPEERAELVAELESRPDFNRLSPTKQKNIRAAFSWTLPHIEAAFRKLMLIDGGLTTDSFTELTIKFQRTMRIPDDGKTYPLPTGLSQLPLCSVDDFSETAPVSWLKKGGVIMPTDQSEALCIWFSSRYHFAVKVAAGKMNALTGEPWSSELQRQPQNYVLIPYSANYDNDGVIRRFVAMPCGAEYSANEQLAGDADVGGMQLQVVPMCAESYYRKELAFFLPPTIREFFIMLIFAPVISAQLDGMEGSDESLYGSYYEFDDIMVPGADGKMRQELHKDPYEFAEWEQAQTARCFVHPCDSSVWRQITDTNPPHPPLTAKDYEEAGIPWLDDYRDDGKPLPENSSITPDLIVQYGNTRRHGEIREFLDIP